MGFAEIWTRIKIETEIRTMSELADFVGSSQPTVSTKKKENTFPVEWAYKVAREYGLNIEWILEGIGSPRPGQSSDPVIIRQLAEWIREEEKREPGSINWFSREIRRQFPEFDRWEKREKDNSAESDTAAKSNIA